MCAGLCHHYKKLSKMPGAKFSLSYVSEEKYCPILLLRQGKPLKLHSLSQELELLYSLLASHHFLFDIKYIS